MISLVSTDFDGTLFESGAEPSIAPSFFNLIGTMQSQGCLWVINTGRSLPQMTEALEALRFPCLPNYLITSERDIFQEDTAKCWVGLEDWNENALSAYEEIFTDNAEFFETLYETVNRASALWPTVESGRFVGVRADTSDAMDSFVAVLEQAISAAGCLDYQRNGVLLRFCHRSHSKGAVLTELQRRTAISPKQTFSAGDHYNDLSMLDPLRSGCISAPSNAHVAVKKSVLHHGGYVATLPYSSGVVEALEYYCASFRD